MRPSSRAYNELRPIALHVNHSKYAYGSCLIKMGDTHVSCTASVEEKVPPFLRNTGSGWITAEYGMLPCATQTRTDREAAKGKQTGRTQEIQRLIGRSLRSVTDLFALGERQIRLDCDVLQADGGTRTAAISGAYIALSLAIQKLITEGKLSASPIKSPVAAVSCGIYHEEVVLDLDFIEDSNASADANFVMTDLGHLIEVQATAEKHPFLPHHFEKMMSLAYQGIQEIIQLQRQVLSS